MWHVFVVTVLQGVLKKTPPADVIRVANQMLISTLTKNLAHMEPSTKRNAVSIRHYLVILCLFVLFCRSRGGFSDYYYFFSLCVIQIESVCALLAKQAAGVRERAAFVVLICTLLQTLESLNASTHLHTAQILFRLLEPSLQKLYALQTEKVSTLLTTYRHQKGNYYLRDVVVKILREYQIISVVFIKYTSLCRKWC